MAEGIGISAFDPKDPFSDSYFTPLGATAAAKMELCWRSVTAGGKVEAGEILNFGTAGSALALAISHALLSSISTPHAAV